MAAVVLHPFDVDDLIGRLSDRATLDLEVLHLSQVTAQGLHRVRTDLVAGDAGTVSAGRGDLLPRG